MFLDKSYKEGKVLVVLPTFDECPFYQKVVNTVANQTYPTSFVGLHIDKDDVYQYVKTINKTIVESDAEYLNFISPSTFLHPMRIELHLAHMKRIGFKMSTTSSTSIRMRNKKVLRIEEKKTGAIEGDLPGNILREVLTMNAQDISLYYPVDPGNIYHRSLFDEFGLFDENLAYMFEIDFLIKTAAKYDFGYYGYHLVSEVYDEYSFENMFSFTKIAPLVKLEREYLGKKL